MKLSCLISLVLYAALVFGYYQWLSQSFDPPALWIASFIVGLIALGGLGAVYNSFMAWRDALVLSDALVDMPRRDGRRTSVAGVIEPVGPALTAPLSGKSCVLYEYDISREITRSKEGGGTETSKSVDFAGLGKGECIIRSTSSRLRLIGFPDLDSIEDEYLTEAADVARARQYVQFTAWEDASGFGVLRGARDMFGALTSAEESLRKDWRMISVQDCAWLLADAPQERETPLEDAGSMAAEASAAGFPADEPLAEPDDPKDDELDDGPDDGVDEDDDELYATWDDGSGYRPHLTEKRMEPGQRVVAIGRYDEVRQGLVGTGAQTIKVYLDDVQSVARKLAASKWRYLLGGIITLVIVNVGVWGAQVVYRNSSDTQRKWHSQLQKAVREGDIQTIEKLAQRGADMNGGRQPEDAPLLLEAKDVAVAKKLLELGADVNGADGNGRTALMVAAQQNQPELLRMLIAAGADLDRQSQDYNTTALMMAINSENPDCVAILRQAGAKDDTATAENGQPIAEDHEAFAVCRSYLEAVFAADLQKLRNASTPSLATHLDGIDFKIWQESRPVQPRLTSGFVRGDDATVTVTGPNLQGSDRTWEYQLRRADGNWRVARERWVIKGVP